MIFKKCIRVRGNLWSSYVFETQEAVDTWLEYEFPKLKILHGNLQYTIEDLDGLEVGDQCYVMGDGTDVYTIEGVFKYSPDRWGFALDAGWSEEVAKCYKIPT